ncbi:hypothetical protein GCM10018954_086350 [Kutzneria kofuensis]
MTAIAREASAGLPDLRATVCFGDWPDTVRSHQETDALPTVRPGDAAQIQYTSGTTGFPKGALLHHRGLVTNARFMIDRTQLPRRGAVVSAMPLFHTAGCAMGVLGSAHQRASYVLCQLFDPTLVLTAAARHHADMLAGVPTMLIALLSHPDFDRSTCPGCPVCSPAAALSHPNSSAGSRSASACGSPPCTARPNCRR